MLSTSTPSISEFDPTIIPMQYQVINDMANFDYDLGVHEILLSGSIGSAKSLLMAHIAIVHCLTYPKAKCLLARKAMPDLRDTILQKVLDHIEGDLEIGRDYWFNETTGRIEFSNGSEIKCRSWADKRYKKFRSLELSCAIVEELTENDSDEFEAFYKELVARVGRLPHIKQNFVICATNPDAPSHKAYDYFIASKYPTRHVYYSITSDNPFLPKTYIEQLKNTFTAQEAQRMLFGQWIEIKSEVIYYSFSEKNIIDSYEINLKYPILITYDFNIGLNKPMSVAFMQYINDKFYVFDEVVIYGSNTLESCDEQIARGLWDLPVKYIIHGDASGRSKSSKYNKSDYDIIKKAMDDHVGKFGRVNSEIDVPLSNPPVRKRHLVVNGQLCNSKGEISVFICKKCETTIKGFRLTKLKEGGSYVEDDSMPFQHITTAIGYGIVRQLEHKNTGSYFSHGSIHGNPVEQRNRPIESRFSSVSYRRN